MRIELVLIGVWSGWLVLYMVLAWVEMGINSSHSVSKQG